MERQRTSGKSLWRGIKAVALGMWIAMAAFCIQPVFCWLLGEVDFRSVTCDTALALSLSLAAGIGSGILLLAVFEGKIHILPKPDKRERVEGIDIVRLLAISFVLMVHALYPCGYYEEVMQGKAMLTLTFVRSFLICCVPLFVTLTGYLNKNKKPEMGYYKKIIPLLFTYIFAWLLQHIVIVAMGGQIDIKQEAVGLLTFRDAGYLTMYIGLFFLSPFLNILWENLHTCINRIELIVVLAFFSSFCTVTYNLSTNFWQGLSPILYYYCGCFFATYSVKVKGWIKVLLLMAVAALQAGYIYFGAGGNVFDWNTFGGYWVSYNALPTVINTCLILWIFDSVKIAGRAAKHILKTVSGLSIEIYLLAATTDVFLIRMFGQLFSSVKEYFMRIIPYTVLNIAVTTCLGILVSWVVRKTTAFMEGGSK